MFLTFDELRVKKASLYCAFYLDRQEEKAEKQTSKCTEWASRERADSSQKCWQFL